jgi:hypothetical protein
MRVSNNVVAFKRPVLLTVLSELAKLSVVGFNDFLFVLYKPNSLISYLTL